MAPILERRGSIGGRLMSIAPGWLVLAWFLSTVSYLVFLSCFVPNTSSYADDELARETAQSWQSRCTVAGCLYYIIVVSCLLVATVQLRSLVFAIFSLAAVAGCMYLTYSVCTVEMFERTFYTHVETYRNATGAMDTVFLPPALSFCAAFFLGGIGATLANAGQSSFRAMH